MIDLSQALAARAAAVRIQPVSDSDGKPAERVRRYGAALDADAAVQRAYRSGRAA